VKVRWSRRELVGALTAGVLLAAVGCQQVRRTESALVRAADAAATRGTSPGNGVLAGPSLPGRIVFGRNGALYVWENGAVQPFGESSGLADPAWSRDGRLLAAVSFGTNHSDLVVLDAGGGGLRQLTHNLSNVSVSDSIWARKPTWSPDRSRLAFITDRGKNDMSLWLIGADGTKLTTLVVDKPFSGGLDWPSWSPTGDEIAFTSFAEAVSAIASVDLKTGKQRTIATATDGALDPAWSPDGKYLAYVGRAGATTDVYVTTGTGDTPTRVTSDGSFRGPVWSPAGDALVLIGANGDRFSLFVSQLSRGDSLAATASVPLAGTDDVTAPSGATWTM
jgi:TolB protein